MSGERQIELTWRCSTCGNRNLGRHLACQRCGNPKDASEEYEMPSDTGAAASVTDPALLRMATAGSNWRCRYCGSHQRRFDGACGNCGAAQAEGSEAHGPPPAPAPAPPSKFGPSHVLLGCAGLFVVFFAFIGFIALLRGGRAQSTLTKPTYREVEATVTAIAWKHVIEVQRYQPVAREGFDAPAGAFDVKPLGKRVHHHDKVPDGFTTETYEETVPDGYETTTYTERVACGKDCTRSPRVCKERCTPNKNGFATCKQECSGGAETCSTRYCNETRTKQAPKTKVVKKTRQVPKYRDEPRYQDYFAWKAWEWGKHREVVAEGASLPARWPDDGEVKLNVGLGKGEQERAERRAEYKVTFGDGAGGTWSQVVTSVDELTRYAPGSRYKARIHDGGTWEILGPVTASPASAPTAASPAPTGSANTSGR